MATPIEISVEETIRGDAAPPGRALHRTVMWKDNSKYVDLGPVPDPALARQNAFDGNGVDKADWPIF